MSRRRRLATGLALALALASGGILVPVGVPVVRAGGGLVTVMDATYGVQPENGLVHVTIDAVSTSFEEDAPEGPVYYAGLSFSIPPGSSNVAADRRWRVPGDDRHTHRRPGAGGRRVLGAGLPRRQLPLPDHLRHGRPGRCRRPRLPDRQQRGGLPGLGLRQPGGRWGQRDRRPAADLHPGGVRRPADRERRWRRDGSADRRRLEQPELVRLRHGRAAGRVHRHPVLGPGGRHRGRGHRQRLGRRSGVGRPEHRADDRRPARAPRAHRPALARCRLAEGRGVRQPARRLRRHLQQPDGDDQRPLRRRWDGHPPRGGAYLVQPRALRRAMDRRGVGRVLRRPFGGGDRRHR